MTAPVLILIGEADQWNSADACKTLRSLAQPDSASIDLTVYPGVHHAFDVAQLKPGGGPDGQWLEYDEPAARDAEKKTRMDDTCRRCRLSAVFIIKNKSEDWGQGVRPGTIRLRKEILCRQCSGPGGIMLASWLTASVIRRHVASPW